MLLDLLNLKPEAFGLDISDLSLKVVKLKKTKKGLLVSSFGTLPLKEGIIKKGEVSDKKALAQSIKKLFYRAKIKTKYVVASLPEEKSFLEVIQMPKLSEEELKKAVFFEAENYIPFSVTDVYLDSQFIRPVFDHLDHSDVLLAALPKKIVNPYVDALKMAGLFPLALEIESQATSRALIKGEFTNRPLLIIDLGATRTSFIIFSGYSLRFTSSIPVSSMGFTKLISKVLKIDISQAESLKVNYGLLGRSKKGKAIFEALIPGLTDLMEQIKKHLDYYQTHAHHEHLPPDGKGLVEKIILCGGGANLKGLVKFLSQEFNLSVVKGNPLVNLGQSREIKDPLSYTTAIGLALRGIKNKF
jgi:type IV pilus assembly protein PilM